jgi:hypothetical protein
MRPMYCPIGAVFTLVTAEIGLAVALQLGAATGSTSGRSKDSDGHRSRRSRTGRQLTKDEP